MPNDPKRLKTQIDFTTLRGSERAQLVMTALNSYNRGSSTGLTASDLIIEAYKNYDATETDEITALIDIQNTSRTFLKRYSIDSIEDIFHAVKNTEVKQNTELDSIKKKFFNFDKDNKETENMWNILEVIRFRDRGFYVYRMLFQYFAHGNSLFYNNLCADRLLAWMKDNYDLVGEYGTERIEKIADIIWRNGAEKEIPAMTDEVPSTPDGEDRLRKAMGLV